MYKTILTVAMATSLSLSAQAQTSQPKPDTPSKLETLVVVASRTETPMRQLGTSVAVMDQEEIESLGFQSLADVLRTLPSVSVSNTGGMGKTSSLGVRGEAGFRTLVRVDGVDITDPTGPQASGQVHHLLSANVARVELLRGPQGMMYGADAGGVLNITTDRVSDGVEGGASLESGRYDSEKYSGYVGGGSDRGDFYVSGARARTDGFNARVDDASEGSDGYENTTLHARGGLNVGKNLRAQVVLRDTDADAEFDGCAASTDNCLEQFDQRNSRASLSHSNPMGENTLAYSKTHVERTNYADGLPSYYTRGTIAKWELNGRAQLTPTHGLAYGLEQRSDEVMELKRDQTGVYLEYQGQYGERLFLTAGARQDDNDDFGGNTSYRVSGAYLIPDMGQGTLKFKSSFGTGFRAPSLSEIDYNRSQNNPDLAPLNQEDSRGLDLGVEYFGNDGLRLEAVLFDQRIEDEIYFDMVAFSGYLQDQRKSESQGLELIAEVPLGARLFLDSNYTYVDTEAADGNPRSRQPRHLTNLALRYNPLETLALSLNWRAAHDRREGETELDDYQLVSASARYQVMDGIVVYLRGENILDEDYVEVPGYNTAGAAGYAGVELSF